eukprot:gene14524-19217_t
MADAEVPMGDATDLSDKDVLGLAESWRKAGRGVAIATVVETWALFPGEIAYVWHGALHAGTVAESLLKTGFTIRAQIVWALIVKPVLSKLS